MSAQHNLGSLVVGPGTADANPQNAGSLFNGEFAVHTEIDQISLSGRQLFEASLQPCCVYFYRARLYRTCLYRTGSCRTSVFGIG